MTAAVERRRLGGRGGLAIGLVSLNVILAALNLDKHDVLPVNLGADSIFATEDGEDTAAIEGAEDGVDGGTTVPGATDDPTSGSVEAGVPMDEEEAGSQTTDPETVEEVWPGGIPGHPDTPEPRFAVLEPSGQMRITGSVPDWQTKTEIGNRAAVRMPGGLSDVLNLLEYQPDASHDPASGDVVFQQEALFDVGQSELDPESVVRFDQVIQLLVSNPTLLTVIIGHTDDQGDADANAALGLQRAEAMQQYMLENGVSPAQIVVATAGEDLPAAGTDALSNSEASRRVELRIKNFFSETGL